MICLFQGGNVVVTVAKVQYVDYGNSEAVEKGSVWAMEEEFASLPIQALKCCLAGVQPADEAWPKGTTIHTCR